MTVSLDDGDVTAELEAAIDARLRAGQLAIPVLPAVAGSVLRLINDPDADAGALAGAIQRDPALAGHVMRFANSAALRGGAPVVSLQQAITRLGMRSIADIALAACMGPKLFKAPRHAALIERIWRESLATALWGREIARLLRRNVEVAFLCGLLHQIGKPVLLQAVQELCPDAGRQPGAEALLAVLARHAAPAGLAVVEHWRLPEPVAQTIAHGADFRQSARSADLVATVSLARAIALRMLDGETPDPAALVDLPETAHINLYPADLQGLLEKGSALAATLEEMSL